MFMLFIVFIMVETTFSNFRDGFLQIISKLHLVCAWNLTHKAYMNDSTSGTKISICLKRILGMRLWIETSTFKQHILKGGVEDLLTLMSRTKHPNIRKILSIKLNENLYHAGNRARVSQKASILVLMPKEELPINIK